MKEFQEGPKTPVGPLVYCLDLDWPPHPASLVWSCVNLQEEGLLEIFKSFQIPAPCLLFVLRSYRSSGFALLLLTAKMFHLTTGQNMQGQRL